MHQVCRGERIHKKHPHRGAFFGAADRDRTGTDFTPRDFKSLVSACSTTAAYIELFMSLRLMVPLSVCGTRQKHRLTAQARFLPTAALVALALASATGGGQAHGRTRTGTDFTPRDFKSLVSTCSTTAAYFVVSACSPCCGARCAPCRRRGCVAHRPRPLARLPSSATGGGRLAPQI